MGYITLAEYQAELGLVLGDSALDATRSARWINFAYYDVIGAVEFEELRALANAGTTTIGSELVAIPAGSRQITAVVLGKSDYLQWIDRTEFLRRDRNTLSTPTHWTRIGASVHIVPVPSAELAVELERKTVPARLSLAASVSSLPDTWDQAIHLLSVAHAYMAKAQEGRAAFWFNRAVAYIQTRASEEGRKLHEPGLALTISAPMQEMALKHGGQQ